MKVLVVGATGHTGGSVVQGLLETDDLEVFALIRPESMNKPGVRSLQAQGVTVVEGDLKGSEEQLVQALDQIDTVISCVGAAQQQDQIPLANAAKKAGVKRFVPCGFITVAPAGGIMWLRDQKETVYNHIKQLWLPYTVVDVGWWYQLAFPRLSSGRIDYMVFDRSNEIFGRGNVPSAITDLRDIGRYIARIIVDERTLNKFVFVYNTVMTQNEVYDLLEEISGEKITRNFVADETVYAAVSEARKLIGRDISDPLEFYPLYRAEYTLSWGIRGDNNPEYAKYLGYVTSEELYPDFQPISFRNFLETVVDGTAKNVYVD
ncbi:hypothetical protein CNMCM5623_003390 [Aspergillus felis]|uniref:NmrA-like domain-containing protein n=1 Tax=Aspergillus felis TaxID=1287682 RepID=A0A8H6R135_9EURO|nr:hypothetical protein CNMCM5623_003390 [Aspergillus felis]KAF7183270.1 hypothetical protein CNMCM7691_003183 [Aspergillus felis]